MIRTPLWKKKGVARRKYVKRRAGVMRSRIGSSVRQPVQFFKRGFFRQDQLIVGTTGNSLGVSFKLNDLPNSTEFTNLYDLYSIRAIKIKLMPRFSQVSSDSTSIGVNEMPNIVSCIDYDDASAPTSMDEVLQYGNHRIHRGNSVITRYFKPALAQQVFQSATSTGFTAKKREWVNSDYPAVPHYGFKVFVPPTQNVTFVYDMYIEYFLAMKQSK